MEDQRWAELIRAELPRMLQRDRGLREWILELTQEQYADKSETESRFDRRLAELRRDREEGARKWEVQEERWAAQNRKWEENQPALRQFRASIDARIKWHDSAIGALGARWGLSTEESFRSALAGILEDSFGVEVLRAVEYDDGGDGLPPRTARPRRWVLRWRRGVKRVKDGRGDLQSRIPATRAEVGRCVV